MEVWINIRVEINNNKVQNSQISINKVNKSVYKNKDINDDVKYRFLKSITLRKLTKTLRNLFKIK